MISLIYLSEQDFSRMSSKELTVGQSSQYVGPYRLEKTLGKGQTGRSLEAIPESGISDAALILIPLSPLIVVVFILIHPS